MKDIEKITVANFRKLQPAGRKQQPETPIRQAIRDLQAEEQARLVAMFK